MTPHHPDAYVPAVKGPMHTAPGLIPDVWIVTPELIVLLAISYALLCGRQLSYKHSFDALHVPSGLHVELNVNLDCAGACACACECVCPHVCLLLSDMTSRQRLF